MGVKSCVSRLSEINLKLLSRKELKRVLLLPISRVAVVQITFYRHQSRLSLWWDLIWTRGKKQRTLNGKVPHLLNQNHFLKGIFLAHSRYLVDKVIIGSGEAPFIPDFDGMDDYSGKVIHSTEFKVLYPYIGQRVLVVGAGHIGLQVANILVEIRIFT